MNEHLQTGFIEVAPKEGDYKYVATPAQLKYWQSMRGKPNTSNTKFEKGQATRLGIKHTEEAKAKMRARRWSDEGKMKISRGLTGKPCSEQKKIKLRLYNLSHHKSPPHARGAAHYNWKGGISSKNAQIKSSFLYQEWKRKVFARDNYTCQACGKRGGKLQVDHELPFAFYPDLRFEVLNGRLLCYLCHEKTPTYKNHKNNIYG